MSLDVTARRGGMLPLLAVLALLPLACGGGQEETKTADNAQGDDTSSDNGGATADEGDGGATADNADAAKPDPCTGFDMDLATALMEDACEAPNPKPDAKPLDVQGKLDVKVIPSSGAVAPGGHVDLTVVMTNKSKAPISLDFSLDPTPRFVVEAYTPKGKRVDMPHGNPPKLPPGVPERVATIHNTARITIVPNGTAKAKVGWDAVRTKWAPKKLRGTPPEEGYPREPAGKLPKGRYELRVVTPMEGIFEGENHEVSAPKVEIVVQ